LTARRSAELGQSTVSHGGDVDLVVPLPMGVSEASHLDLMRACSGPRSHRERWKLACGFSW